MIIGEKVRLRRVDPTRDLDDRYRWMTDPEVLRWLGTRGVPLSRAEVSAYLEKAARAVDEVVEFGVETLDGRHIGGTTLRRFERWSRQAEFAIAIGEADFRGKGYGSEVTALMVDFAFGRLNLNRVWLTVNVQNGAGIKAYQKAGFQIEGTLRENVYAGGRYWDSHIMGALRRDWAAGNANGEGGVANGHAR